MKKNILGFLLGVGVMFSTTVIASGRIEEVSAYLQEVIHGRELDFAFFISRTL
ncbi:hypothetical protein [Paenibacillus whitsoniae]|uniref:hypothetical protein n=1 Tax=Paenibacillus whitsoniae TaxID=2496558 RepID=UPI0013DEB6E1|nr:hypothetical protein [Paenibacillus whitsoniae]